MEVPPGFLNVMFIQYNVSYFLLKIALKIYPRRFDNADTLFLSRLIGAEPDEVQTGP
jgi:hypothetical protein